MNDKNKIVVLGLGYVGLPLAIAFGKKFPTYGFDVSKSKIESYKLNCDPNGEVSSSEFQKSQFLSFSNDEKIIKQADFIFVAVPTPIDKAKIPDLSLLRKATIMISKNMKKGSIIVFEPTVYPGVTENICIPLLEKEQNFKWKKDFYVGYSPERINPGDKENRLETIVKIVSGDSPETLEKISAVYEDIIDAGIYKVSSIKVAEAAKVIENTQRDLNIALMNELAVIFHKMGVDTSDVIDAANSKWNFLNFRPGLVGGHCVGVDPYYLTYKCQLLGYNPQVILSGRRINDTISNFIAKEIIKKMINKNISIKNATVTMLGLTFKENCNDIRNSKIFDIYNELKEYGCNIILHDPLASEKEIKNEYNVLTTSWNKLSKSDVLVVAVSHDFYLNQPLYNLLKLLNPKGIFVDIKSSFDKNYISKKGFDLWRL